MITFLPSAFLSPKGTQVTTQQQQIKFFSFLSPPSPPFCFLAWSVQIVAKVLKQHSNSAPTAENLCLQRSMRGPSPLSNRLHHPPKVRTGPLCFSLEEGWCVCVRASRKRPQTPLQPARPRVDTKAQSSGSLYSVSLYSVIFSRLTALNLTLTHFCLRLDSSPEIYIHINQTACLTSIGCPIHVSTCLEPTFW